MFPRLPSVRPVAATAETKLTPTNTTRVFIPGVKSTQGLIPLPLGSQMILNFSWSVEDETGYKHHQEAWAGDVDIGVY